MNEKELEKRSIWPFIIGMIITGLGALVWTLGKDKEWVGTLLTALGMCATYYARTIDQKMSSLKSGTISTLKSRISVLEEASQKQKTARRLSLIQRQSIKDFASKHNGQTFRGHFNIDAWDALPLWSDLASVLIESGWIAIESQDGGAGNPPASFSSNGVSGIQIRPEWDCSDSVLTIANNLSETLSDLHLRGSVREFIEVGRDNYMPWVSQNRRRAIPNGRDCIEIIVGKIAD